MKTALAISAIFFGVVLTASFQQSLPLWCAHPEGNGNWIISNLCEKGN